MRTPLNAIIGFSQVMAGEMLGPMATQRYVGYARDILGSAEHLLGIINDILDVSKLETGKLDLIEEAIDAPKAIADLIVLVDGKAKAADIRLVARQEGEVPLLRGDLRKVKQIVLNLVTNAIKFSRSGGEVEIVLKSDSGAALIAVVDRGIGMDPHEVELAMTRFGQVTDPWTRDHAGTGLGLPLAIGLAEVHGANLTIDSTKGVGTTVTVHFPAARSQGSARRKRPGRPADDGINFVQRGTAMPRTSIASLGAPLFRAVAEPSALPVSPGPQPIPTPAARPASARLARLTVLGLGIAGVLPPLAFTARPGELGLIGAVPVSIALTALLILAPALVGLVAALFGLEGVRASFRVRGDKEHEQAVLRVFVAALAVVYGFAVAAYGDTAASCQVVAALGLAGAWVFLLLTMLDPIPSPLRYYAGTIFDAALLAAFLHFGAALTAPWFPLFLLATFYAGFRFGPAALGAAAIANLIGFTAAVATTPFWQQQVLLAGGLLIAMIVLPAYVGSMVREVAESRAAAAAAQAARTRFLMVISQALRAPLDAIIGTVGAAESGQREPEAPAVVPGARALLSQVNNILDFSAIEAGAFVPAIEAFDLHRVVNDTLADRRAEAKARGLKLRVHIDPALPYRLRGWPQQLAQILDYLVARAIEVTGGGAVRIAIDAGGGSGNTVHLRIAVRDEGSPIAPADAEAMFDPFAADKGARSTPSAHGAFGLAVVKRLVELMGGRIAIDSGAAKGGSFTITVPLVVDQPATDSELDLGHCLVLIATEDSQFASDLAEPLNAWHGDPRWIEGFGGTLGFVDRRDSGACSVLIVDGRTHMLAALSFAHRAVSGPSAPSFVLVVAEAAQLDGLLELADGELDGVLAAPLDNQLLANALHSLPLWHGAASRPVMVPETLDAAPAVEEPPASILDPPAAAAAIPQVTPISVHPRFGGETPTVDPRAIAALRGLGDGDDFLAEVIDSFRAETKDIMQRIVRAAAAADAGGFARGLHALRSCAGNLGGTRLCELLLAMREISQRELREQGSGVVQRLGDELARLDAALLEFLPERDAARLEA